MTPLTHSLTHSIIFADLQYMMWVMLTPYSPIRLKFSVHHPTINPFFVPPHPLLSSKHDPHPIYILSLLSKLLWCHTVVLSIWENEYLKTFRFTKRNGFHPNIREQQWAWGQTPKINRQDRNPSHPAETSHGAALRYIRLSSRSRTNLQSWLRLQEKR